MVTLIAFVVALGVLITIHELGHYGVARACGVKILKFSFGFGPVLWSKKFGKDQTEWMISALPLGGYVSMLDERDEKVTVLPEEAHRAFNRQSVFKRFAIVAAGPAANLILAVLIYAAMAMAGQPEIRPVMAEPVTHSQAAQLGVKPLDRVLSLNGKTVEGLEDLNWLILENAGVRDVPMQLLRGGDRATIYWDLSELQLDNEKVSPFEQLGIRLHLGSPMFFNIQSGSAAEAAGIQEGDAVIAVNGRYGTSPQELLEIIRRNGSNALQLVLEDKEGNIRTVSVTPRLGEVKASDGSIERRPLLGVYVGIKPDIVWIKKGPIEALGVGISRIGSITKTTYNAVRDMVIGKASTQSLSGPVTIADWAGKSAQLGWRTYLSFLAMISVSLGLLNLLPIPLLDGGHLLYYSLEILRGRPLPESVMLAGQKIGLCIVLLLGALALSNDFLRLLE